jgi:hypothetical protein
MALGSQTPRRKRYFLSLQAKKDNVLAPHFRVQTRENNQTITLNDEVEFSGNLLSLGHGQYEHEGKTQRTIIIILVDGDNEYKLEVNTNTNTGRNIMNRFIGPTGTFGWIVIRTYLKDQKYVGIHITSDGQRLEWKYSADDVKDKIDTYPDPQNEGKFIKVYHKLNNLLLNDWIKIEAHVAESAREKGLDKINDDKEAPHSAPPAQHQQEERGLQEELDNMVAPDPNDYKPPVGINNPEDPDDSDLPF